MHPRQFWIALGLFASFGAAAAVIYKWTDAQGVVHFSDQPAPGAEKIVTETSSANGIGGTTHFVPPPSRNAPVTGGRLKAVAIDSPAKEQVFFNDDVVAVHLQVDPGLQSGQSVSWQLNGKRLDQPPGALSFSLPALPRGAYVIAATVTDPNTGESQSADSVTFYVRQPSELSPQHKKP